MYSNTALTISLPGLNIYDQSLLLTAIQQLSEDGKSFCLLENNNENAHLVVVDDDNARGKKILQHNRKGQIKLVLSSQPVNSQNLIAIKKPADLKTVTVLLGRIFTKMQDQLVNTHTVQKSAPTPNMKKYTKIDGIFTTLLKLKDNHEIACLNLPDFHTIYVDGKNRSLATSASIDEIRNFVHASLIKAELKSITHTEFTQYSTGLNIYPLHNILWIAALASPYDRPIKGHDINKPVKLRAWPNFTRYDYNPEHFKLAAMLAQYAIPLSEMEAKTHIPYPIILRFFNAAYAIDLIVPGVSEPPLLVPIDPPVKKRKSLFAKIAQKLNIRI